jgi:thiol-disulfide isomerase/thioredoxin
MIGRWLGNALGHAMVAAIVLITPANASAAAACDAPPDALGKFSPSTDADPPPLTPFFDAADVPRTFADFQGEALVVNFWATWCAPCVKEMPALDRLAEAVDGDGITVLALSADREGADVVRAFYDVNALNNLAVSLDRRMAVSRALGIPGLPTTVLIDRDGREIGRLVGAAEWDAPEAVDFLRRCLTDAAG